MNIALIGFRGSGKTTIGKRLAKRLNMKFVDLDRQIEKDARKSIPGIFSDDGESGFRELEKKAVKRLGPQDNLCIACGGGVVLYKGNIDKLKSNSVIILLEADAKTLHRRIRHDRNRPKLTALEGIEEVRHLLEKREGLYNEAAQMRFDTSKRTPEQTVQEIIDALNEKGLL